MTGHAAVAVQSAGVASMRPRLIAVDDLPVVETVDFIGYRLQ